MESKPKTIRFLFLTGNRKEEKKIKKLRNDSGVE
jgi:hypothetical protein